MGQGRMRLAIFPVENLSGSIAPLKEIRQTFAEELRAQGVDVLEEEDLERVMVRHRIRYTGGIDREVARAFKEEAKTDAVLILSLELYSEANPPKISLLSRLVSTDDPPAILWDEGVGLAGDDSPGVLGLGLIEDPNKLLLKGMKFVFDSLVRFLSIQNGGSVHGVKRKFRPRVVYQSPVFDPNRKYTVAVIPFFNRSGRRYAGEIMVLHFIRELGRFGNFHLIEPGVIRQVFLEFRIVMEDGVSLSQADVLFGAINADLILSGRVIEYEDYQGSYGKPKVEFSAQLIERKSREVVWSSNSYNAGDDGVFFFDRGRVNTAHVMASQMTRLIGERMTR
jgi:TolB-like protein